MTEGLGTTEQPGRSIGLPLLVWLLLAACLIAAFAHNFGEMWIRWFPAWKHGEMDLYSRITLGQSYYTHGPLVPLVSLLIGILLIRHTRIKVRPQRVVGMMILILSLLLHLMACLARVNFVSGFAFIGVVMGLILLIWGAEALRRLWFPVAFLIFMVPLPEVTVSNVNFKLKMLAASWGVSLANIIGIAAERVGNQVLLDGDKSLVIANVCNGLRTIISLLAFGAIYAYACQLRGLWRLFLFAASLAVALVSNSVRIVSLILVADVWNPEVATGWYHDASGIMVFVIALLLMFGLERLILWARRTVGWPAKIIPLFAGVRRDPKDNEQSANLFHATRSTRGWVAVVLMLVSVGGAFWLQRSIPPRWNQSVAEGAIPERLEVAGTVMNSYPIDLDKNTLITLETSDYLNRVYVAPGMPHLTYCIIFSKDNRKGTHPPDLCISGAGDGILTMKDLLLDGNDGDRPVPCRELIVQMAPQQRQYFIYTYKCGGSYTNSFWNQQFSIFTNGLLNRDSSGALIRVSTRVTTTVEDARKRSMQLLRKSIPYLDENLK